VGDVFETFSKHPADVRKREGDAAVGPTP
jgi:hypothetical protein